jgi:low temperature requirement protein LtrA
MRGLVLPEQTEDFTADPVELFFDLAFVFAFSRLVYLLVHDPTWTGAAEAGLLFLILWFGWSVFTWAANAVSGNTRPVRLIFLIATATSVPMGASVSNAFDSGGATFAICASIIMLMALGLQLLTFDRDSFEFRWLSRFGSAIAAASALLIIGGFLDESVRVVLWVVFVVVALGTMMAAGQEAWGVRAGHFAERHGLIIIIALGEVVVAIGISVVSSLSGSEGLPNRTLIALTAAGVLAVLLWWSYFDRVLPALEHRLEEEDPNKRGSSGRDVYTLWHIPIVAGIITTAAAAEEILLHPSDATLVAFRVMFVVGIAGFYLGISGAVARAFRIVAKERIAAVVAIAILALAGGSLSGVSFLLIADAILLVCLGLEHLRIEGVGPKK